MHDVRIHYLMQAVRFSLPLHDGAHRELLFVYVRLNAAGEMCIVAGCHLKICKCT